MKQQPDELSLLDQHIFKQNQHIIEMSARLDGFLSKGNSAIEFAEKKASERNTAIQWVIGGVLVCAVIFGGAGYVFQVGVNAVNLSRAKDLVAEANKTAEKATADLAAYQVIADKNAAAEIEKIRAASGWAGTPAGRLAKQFFDVGGGLIAANCKGDTWDIVENKEGKWCVPKRRDLLGDSMQYGWKIP